MRAQDIQNRTGLERVAFDEKLVSNEVILRLHHLEQTISDLTFELNQMQKQIQRIQ
jgi:hypothetical protein